MTSLKSALKQIFYSHRETVREWKSKLDDVTEKHVQLKDQLASPSKRCEQCAGLLEQNRILMEDFKDQMNKKNDSFIELEKTLWTVVYSSEGKENEEGHARQKKITKSGPHLNNNFRIEGQESTVASQEAKEYNSKISKSLHKQHMSRTESRKDANKFDAQNDVDIAISVENATEDRGIDLDPGLSTMSEALELNSGEEEEMGNVDATSFDSKIEFQTKSDEEIDEERSDDNDEQTRLTRNRFLGKNDRDENGEVHSPDSVTNFTRQNKHSQDFYNRSIDSKHDVFESVGGNTSSSKVSHLDKQRTRMDHGFQCFVSLPTLTDSKDKGIDSILDQQEEKSQITHKSIIVEEIEQQGHQFVGSSRQMQHTHQIDSHEDTMHGCTDTNVKPNKHEKHGKRLAYSGRIRRCKQAPTSENPYKYNVDGERNNQSRNPHKHKQMRPGDKTYKCDECGKDFARMSNLNEHKRTHTGEKPYTCDVCGKRFSQANNLNRHKQIHSGKKPHKCTVCEHRFIDSGSLYSHMRTHTGEKPYKCDVCGKLFGRSSNLNDHKRIHTGEKPYKCGLCGKGFRQSSSRQKHQLTHSIEKPYKCDVCGKGFISSNRLDMHKLAHTGEKPDRNIVCDNGLDDSTIVHKNEQKPMGEKPYMCDVCGKGFGQSRNLNNHKETHRPTEERTYKCDVCDKGFGVLWTLITHKRIHTGERPYMCDVCGKGFRQGGSLNTHKRTHTGEKPYKCDVCGRGFGDLSTLYSHKRTHTGEKPYKCDVCDKSFGSSGILSCHKRTHTGLKPYECDICGKGFTLAHGLRRHKRTHTGEKSFKSDVNFELFNQKI